MWVESCDCPAGLRRCPFQAFLAFDAGPVSHTELLARRAADSSSTRLGRRCAARRTMVENGGTMGRMCRNIRPLNNFEPPASRDEVRDAALQYVRKVAGMSKPSKVNEAVFYRAVEQIAHATQHLLDDLVTTAPPKNREVEAAKARARSANRFATA
jgi:hypothetical protein